MKVKICGITRIEDAGLALRLGATEIGLIFAPSPRQVSVEVALAIKNQLKAQDRVFGVFVNEKMDIILKTSELLNLAGVQLHGQETAEDVAYLKKRRPKLEIFKTIGVADQKLLINPLEYGLCDALVFDSATSHFNFRERKALTVNFDSPFPFYLAGGLNPDNVVTLVNHHCPMGIDLSSGVEAAPGKKDPDLLKKLFSVLKECHVFKK